MIDTLQRISTRLSFLKPVLILLGITALGCGAVEIFMVVIPDADDVLLTPAIVITLWSIIGFTALNSFPHIPDDTQEKLGFLKRLALKFQRAMYYGLATIFAILTVAALYVSYKLLSIWA